MGHVGEEFALGGVGLPDLLQQLHDGLRTMRILLGVPDDIQPEDCYRHWFSCIEPDYVEMVQEAVRANMTWFSSPAPSVAEKWSSRCFSPEPLSST